MYNKRYIRLVPLLLLTLLATLLLVLNLLRAQELSGRQLPFDNELKNRLTMGDEEELKVESLGYILEEREIRTARTRHLEELLNCHSRELRLQQLQHGDFWLMQNLVVGRLSRSMGCAESITYTTHGDYSFFDNLETLTARWRAPISFAIHAPGYDVIPTMDAIQYVRNCLPDSALIRDYVTFHLYFSNSHMPEYVPLNENEALNWPYICTEADGSLAPPPYSKPPPSAMYKVQHNLTYPINVGRNIARQAANTHFIFACDIELYPSVGLAEQFLDMVARNHSVLAPRRVFPLPVFELQANASVPRDKAELLALYRTGAAQAFHAHICINCHVVPGQPQWLERASSVTDKLRVFSVGRRTDSFRFWEPFYISDNTEPMFDERVTWEGQSNKRIQGYAMCLMDYEYHVLHPAFLAHSPGFKKNSGTKSPRFEFAKQMTKFIKTKIEPEYRVLYGHNKKCTT